VKQLLIIGIVLFGVLSCSDNASENKTPNLSNTSIANPESIHTQALSLDSHIDISLEFATDAEDPLNADIQASLEKMLAGELDAAFFIVYVGQSERTPETYAKAQADAMTKFKAIHRMVEELYPDRIGFADSPAEVERLVAEGKLAAMIGIENGFVIGKDLSLLDKYYELGARYLTLVHNGHNDLGDSAQAREQLGDKETEHDGLSEFGIATVRRMNELGVMVDVSHVSKQTALDAIALSIAPVIASHSSIRAVADHPRNLDDETLDALKAKGGVVQVVAFDAYLKIRPEYTEARTAVNKLYGFDGRPDPDSLAEDVRAEYLREVKQLNEEWPPANLSDFVDHIDYAVKRIGINHVGISSDFGGGGGIVGWSNAAETPNVTIELVKRGYSQEEINKLWSGNLLRVWGEVERVAQGL
jgi:membrane dipeptidase